MTDNINTLPTLLPMPRQKTATFALLLPERLPYAEQTRSAADPAFRPARSASRGYPKSRDLDAATKGGRSAHPLAAL